MTIKNPSEEVKEYNAVLPDAFASGNDTIEMISFLFCWVCRKL